METLNIHTLTSQNLAQEAAKIMLHSLLNSNFFSQPSLLLLSGGSCISVATELVSLVPAEQNLNQLTIGLADERWVQPGSADSNEQQLREKGVFDGFESKGARFISMLSNNPDGVSAADSVNKEYAQLFADTSSIALLAGMGEDGHTLGILPQADAAQFFQHFSTDALVTYYELSDQQENPHKKRITTTLTAVSKIPSVFLFATGENKVPALQHLKNKDETVNNKPVLGLYLSEQPLTLLTDAVL